MKKTFLVIAMIGLMVGGNWASAQDDSSPKSRPEKQMDHSPKQKAAKRTERMTEELGLSADQSKRVGEINLNHAEEMEVIHKQMRELKDQAKAKKDAYEKEIDSVLTEEQRVIRAKKMEEHKDKRKEHRPEGDCHH